MGFFEFFCEGKVEAGAIHQQDLVSLCCEFYHLICHFEEPSEFSKCIAHAHHCHLTDIIEWGTEGLVENPHKFCIREILHCLFEVEVGGGLQGRDQQFQDIPFY